jgi:hypothetical protein
MLARRRCRRSGPYLGLAPAASSRSADPPTYTDVGHLLPHARLGLGDGTVAGRRFRAADQDDATRTQLPCYTSRTLRRTRSQPGERAVQREGIARLPYRSLARKGRDAGRPARGRWVSANDAYRCAADRGAGAKGACSVACHLHTVCANPWSRILVPEPEYGQTECSHEHRAHNDAIT